MALPVIDNFANFQPRIEKPVDDNTPESNIWGDTFNPKPFDTSKYTNIDKDNRIPFSNEPNYLSALDETRAQNQTIPTLIGHAAYQALTGIGGSLVSGVGALFHPQSILSKEYNSNVLDDLGEAITKSGQDAAPIYLTKKAQEGISWDKTWGFSWAPGMISSLALMLPGMGVVKGLGMLGESIANAKNVGTILGSIGKGAEAMSSAEGIGAAVTGGVINNHIMSYVTAAQQYTQLRDQAKQLGMDDATANEYAGDGARRTYQLNLLNLGFEIPQLGVLLKGTSFLNRGLTGLRESAKEAAFQFEKKATGNVIEDAIDQTIKQTVKNPDTWKSTIGEFGKVAGLGSAFQLIMGIANNEGKYYVEHKYGINTDENSFASRLADDLTLKSALEAVVSGVAMGAIMDLGKKGMTNFLYKKHYANEENRITDFIKESNEFIPKLKNIQDLQSKGDNYGAELTHQLIVNDIVASGIKHGTFDLHKNLLENLSKVNFIDLNEDQVSRLNEQGLDEKSPEIAKNLYDRTLKAKDIFDKHFKANYLDKIEIKDPTIGKDDMKNHLSMVAGEMDATIHSIDDILLIANAEHEQLKKDIIKPVNDKPDGKVKDHITALTTQKGLEFAIKDHEDQVADLNLTNQILKARYYNEINQKAQESKPSAIDPLVEQNYNKQISNNNTTIKELSTKIDELSKQKSIIDSEVQSHEKDVENYNSNKANASNSEYKKLDTKYNDENIAELKRTIDDPDFINKSARISNVKKWIDDTNINKSKLKVQLNDFITKPEVRQKFVDETIKEHQKVTEQIHSDFKDNYEAINKVDNTDNSIEQIKDFLEVTKKERRVDLSDLIKNANDDLKKLNKLKVEEDKIKDQNKVKDDLEKQSKQTAKDKAKVVKNKVSDEVKSSIPPENKDIDLKGFNHPLNTPINQLKDDVNIEPHTYKSTSKPIDFKVNPELEENPIYLKSKFSKVVSDNFIPRKDGTINIRKGKSADDITLAINELNTIKDNYLKVVKTNEKAVKDVEGEDYDITNGKMLDIINRINNLTFEINKTGSKEPKINLDFTIGSDNEYSSSKAVLNHIAGRYLDPLTQTEIRHEFTNKLLEYRDADQDAKPKLKKELEELVNKIYSDITVEKNVKFSKGLADATDKVINNRSKIVWEAATDDLTLAYQLYLNNMNHNGDKVQFLNFNDLMTAVYKVNPDLVPKIFKDVNLALILRSKVLTNPKFALEIETGSQIKKVVLSNIFETNPNKLFIDADKIEKESYLKNELLPYLKSRVDAIEYEPTTGMYGQALEQDRGRINVPKQGISLQDIPSHNAFEEHVNALTSLNSGSKITLYVKGTGLDSDIDILSDGKVIATMSKPSFTYGGVEYSKLVDGEYQFRNPFENKLTNKVYDSIEDRQDILRDIYFKHDKEGLERLKNGTYNRNVKDSKEEGNQKELYKTYLYFLEGQSSKTELDLEAFRQLVKPLFTGRPNSDDVKLSKIDIVNRLDRHIERFNKDFNIMMEVRKNPSDFKLSLEKISGGDVLYDDKQDHLLNETIKSIDNRIRVLGIHSKDVDNNTLYDLTTGLKLSNVERKRGDKNVLFLGIPYSNDIIMPHKAYVSHVFNNKFKDPKYQEYSKKSVAFIKDEFIKLVTGRMKGEEGDDLTNIKNNLNKLIVTDDETYFKIFDKSPDNITFKIVMPYDETSESKRVIKKIKIGFRDNHFELYEGEVDPDSKEKVTLDTSKDAIKNGHTKVVYTINDLGENVSKLNETQLRDKLDDYIPNILRNFHYDKNKIDIKSLNDTADPTKDTKFYEPTDKYQIDKEGNRLKDTDGFDIINKNREEKDYLDFAIKTGALKTNIGAIKSDDRILSNFNFGYNTSNVLAMHFNYERIAKETPLIETIKNTKQLESVPSFEKYKDLLKDDEGKDLNIAVKFTDKNTLNENNAFKTVSGKHTTIDIYKETKSGRKVNIENELAHELIHAQLDSKIPKLSETKKESLYKDINRVKDKIKATLDGTEKSLSELTDTDRKLLEGLVVETLKEPQELFTYIFTNHDVAAALNKIAYEKGLASEGTIIEQKTIWNKLLDIIHSILGNTDDSVIRNINEILNSSLTSPELDISKQTGQMVEPKKSKPVKPNKNVESELNKTGSNVNIDLSNTPIDVVSEFIKKKNSTILNSENDYKIVNSQEFIDFNKTNDKNTLADNLEYFKKCYK